MTKTTSLVILIASGLLLGLGLLFLCASAAAPDKAAIRILLAVALVGLGAGGAVWSGRTYRRLGDIEPARLADRILDLVRRLPNPELTTAEAVSELGAPGEAVRAALELLQGRGEARLEQREERLVYVFPNLKEGKVVRRCVHCGTEFPVKQSLSRCPNCGGKIDLQRT